MSEIKLIVGLGNPGHEYDSTRHNAGFWWVDAFAHLHSFFFKTESKFHGLVARSQWDGREICLLKPQTFMNVSGRLLMAPDWYIRSQGLLRIVNRVQNSLAKFVGVVWRDEFDLFLTPEFRHASHVCRHAGQTASSRFTKNRWNAFGVAWQHKKIGGTIPFGQLVVQDFTNKDYPILELEDLDLLL